MMQKPTYLIMMAAVFSGCNQPAPQKETKPNLLIIHTDEHNFRTLGCYRKEMPDDQAYVWGKGIAVETPHIDWLADHGLMCTRFYATTPVCSPSRSAFMTGCYPQNTEVVTNDIPMTDRMVTFAQVLKEQGYATGYAGKWHLDGDGKPQWAPERNFGFTDNRYMFNRGHWKQLVETANGPAVATHNANGVPNYDIKGADSINFTTDFLTRVTIQFIREHKDSSFCFMVSIPDPHGPNTVRAPYDTLYSHLKFKKPFSSQRPDDDLPAWGKKAKHTVGPKQMAEYFGMVKCIDDNIGKIMACLTEEGLIDHTIVVFTSDHGDLCGEHGLDNKSVPFETSAGIPFILSYPGHLPQGKVVDATLSCVDFQPSILSLMGQPHSGKEEGRDASKIFLTGKVPSNWDDVVFIRGTGSNKGKANKWVSAISGNYKLIFSEVDHDLPWLFDLGKDPNELTNEFYNPEYHDIVQHLSEKLMDYGNRYHDPRVLSKKIAKEIKAVNQ